MTYIHKGSVPVISEENQLFSLPNTLSESFESFDIELGPTTSVTDSSYIEFEVTASESEFIVLCATRFRCLFTLKKQVTDVKTGIISMVDIADTDSISVCNNLVSSLWRTVEVSIEDKTVTSPTNMYGYRALLENLIGYSERGAKAVLENGVWALDKGADRDSITLNNGLQARRLAIQKPVELSGPLHVSLFQQSRPLVSGVKMKVRLIPQQQDFVIHKSGKDLATIVKYTITKPRLVVRKMIPSPSYKLAVEKLLLTQNCKYPIERVQMKSYTIPVGSSSLTLENVVSGQLPKHVLMCMVDQSSFSGIAGKNPYDFKAFDLNYLALEIDGRMVPSKALAPSFEAGQYLDAYEQLLDSMGRLHMPDPYMSFDRWSYANGNTIFGFDLTPSKSGLGAMSLVHRGNMRIHLGWAKALPSTITLIMRFAYDNVIDVTRDRLVNFDFVL